MPALVLLVGPDCSPEHVILGCVGSSRDDFALKAHPSKVALAFWINLIFAALYTVTVVIYTLISRLPAFAQKVTVKAC